MIECVILFRNPGNGCVGFIATGGEDADADDIAVFRNRDEAVALTRQHSLLLAWPHQIVEFDEL